MSFSDGSDCTTNAWGAGVVQTALVDSVANDPAVLALGLAEAWACATPAAVQKVLGWAGNTGERNGVALLARYGFAGSPRWLQLDTSSASNPADTMWVVTAPVCLDPSCSGTIDVFATHWTPLAATQAVAYSMVAP